MLSIIGLLLVCKFREICQNAHQLKAVDVRDFGVYERGFQVRRYGGGGCASGGAVMGETFQATSLHTPCGVEGMGTDVSTWGSCRVGLGKGCEGMGAQLGVSTPCGVETMWASSVKLEVEQGGDVPGGGFTAIYDLLTIRRKGGVVCAPPLVWVFVGFVRFVIW